MSTSEIVTLAVAALVGIGVAILRARSESRELLRPPQKHSDAKPTPTFDEVKHIATRRPEEMG